MMLMPDEEDGGWRSFSTVEITSRIYIDASGENGRMVVETRNSDGEIISSNEYPCSGFTFDSSPSPRWVSIPDTTFNGSVILQEPATEAYGPNDLPDSATWQDILVSPRATSGFREEMMGQWNDDLRPPVIDREALRESLREHRILHPTYRDVYEQRQCGFPGRSRLDGRYDYSRDDHSTWVQAPNENDVDGGTASRQRFDLVKTELCWKKVVGIECGEPASEDSDTGLCDAHYRDIRDQHAH